VDVNEETQAIRGGKLQELFPTPVLPLFRVSDFGKVESTAWKRRHSR
jgi:hypothetical protein